MNTQDPIEYPTRRKKDEKRRKRALHLSYVRLERKYIGASALSKRFRELETRVCPSAESDARPRTVLFTIN